MTDLVAIGTDVDWPDSEAAGSLRARRPAGADGGVLDELAEWLTGVQGSDPPRDFRRVRIIAFGGPGCSAEVAELGGASVHTVGAVPRAEGGASAATTPAVTAGAELADREIDGGADLLVLAVTGGGTEAMTLVSVLTDTEPVKVLPRGADLTPDEWMALAMRVRDDRRRSFALRHDAAELLAAAGSADIAAAAAVALRAAARRTPVLLDGMVATVAALAAYEVQPRAVRWWRAADRSSHPAHALALTRLGQRPLLELGSSLSDGTAGALATAVLRAAVHTAPEAAPRTAAAPAPRTAATPATAPGAAPVGETPAN